MVSEKADIFNHQPSRMSTTKHESIKIAVINKADYPTWKVKMMMYLEAVDPDVTNRIIDGPNVRKKLVPQEETTPEHYVDKLKCRDDMRRKI